jgi:site-specific recombinase XerD
MSSQTGKDLPRGDPSPLHFDALVDAWLGVLAERPGRGPSSAQQVRLRQHLAVLRRVANETPCRDGDGHGLTVDIGAGVLPLAPGSVDELAERLVDAGYPFATHQQIAQTWRQFAQWVLSEHAPQPPDRSHFHGPVSFADDDIDRLFRAARSPDSRRLDAWPDRDRAVLTVLFAAGPRSAELVALMKEDLSVRSRSLRLATPHRPRREIPLSPLATAELTTYMENDRRPTQRDRFLFVRRGGRPFNPATLHRIARQLIADSELKIEGAQRVRAFRNTYIYRQIGEGVAPSVIAARLGVRTAAVEPFLDAYRPHLRTDLDAALQRTSE